jgi:oligo-1,6-glucosidase
MLATLLHTLRGTPFVYQGEEVGMTNYPFDSLAEFRDVDTLNAVREAVADGEVESFEAVAGAVGANSRDNARTPMQWTDGPNAGFTDGEPWIPVNPNRDEVNVAAARADPDSILHYYRRLIALRGTHDVVVYGDYTPLTPDHDRLWVYTRALETDAGVDRLLVALNLAGEATDYEVPAAVAAPDARLLLGNYGDDGDPERVGAPSGDLRLRPWEARVYRSPPGDD